MFISPLKAINEGWIRSPGCESLQDWQDKKLVSPNAIDFTLDTVYVLDYMARPYICEDKKRTKMRGFIGNKLSPHCGLDDDYLAWEIPAGRVHDGMSNMFVEVPAGVCAMLFTRSTFTRNGTIITSGLYDSGFSGHIGFTIYTIGGSIWVEPGTRIGQIAFIPSESAGIYAGGWNHTEGTHYTQPTLQ